MTVQHKWVVDYEPVADSPVIEGSGASTPRHVPASQYDDGEGENRNGIAVVITDGTRRVEVGRIQFKAHLKRRSQLERKLRDIEEAIAQPACDARNAAEERLATVRREATIALERARADHDRRVREAREALRAVEAEPIKPWTGEAAIEAEPPDSGAPADED